MLCLSGSRYSEQRELLSEGGGLEKNATSQLDSVMWSIQKRKLKKRRENQHTTRLELRTDDALVESRWVVWSSKMPAPSRKQNFLLFKCF